MLQKPDLSGCLSSHQGTPKIFFAAIYDAELSASCVWMLIYLKKNFSITEHEINPNFMCSCLQ